MSLSPIAAQPNAGAEPIWADVLADGSRVLVRPVTRLDADAERDFILGLSPRSMRNRFMGRIARPSDAFIAQLTDVDAAHDVALAAVVMEGALEKFVGVARYAVGPDPDTCDFAIVVADAWQNRGLGTRLMQHLIELARRHGVTRMVSVDLAENVEMRELARDLGFACRVDPDDAHQVVYSRRLDG